jgi:YD repeat-containing protein
MRLKRLKLLALPPVSILCLLLTVCNQAKAQTASFLGLDTATQGTWHGSYGADGHSIVNDSQTVPSYASFTVQNQTNYTWASSTTDIRALQTGSGSGRIASTWFSGSTFNFDLNLTDGNSHQFALYALDWDNGGRAETIQVLNASTLAVLDSRSISSFRNGQYVVWNISGHVKIKVTVTAGPNAVISGAFWDPTGTFGSLPTITSLSPTSGAAGTSVTIAGTNFGGTQGSSTVTFNGSVATPTGWSATSIVVPVPSAASSGPVVVTIGSHATSGVTFTVAPNITSISPTVAGVNAFVTISGTGFGATPGTSTVTFNGVSAKPTAWSASSIVVSAPANGTSGPVVVTVGGIASNGASFAYSSVGTISGVVTRASDGTGLAGASVQALIAGNVNGSANTASDGSYSITGLTAGVYDLSISATGYVPSLKSSNLVAAATTTTVNVILGAPTTSGLSPNSGPVGIVVKVSGSYFGATQGTSTLTFNGVAATPTSWSNAAIVAPVPTGATTGPVVVTVQGVSSSGTSFTVGTGTIAGTITRASDGTSISGAQIAALQQNAVLASTSTVSNGTYTLSGLAPGTYDVRISASGFGTSLQTGNAVTASNTTTVNAALASPGTVAGKVTKSDGITAIVGANVAVLQSNDTVGSATTDGTGSYNIPNLTAGTYSAQVSAIGYASQTQTGVSVTAGNTTTVNLNLLGQSVITYVYDPLGRLTGAVDSQSNTARYSYDAVGNLVSISNNPSSQVSVIGFIPQAGPVSSSVTISGTAFSTTPSLNTVQFNGTSATVSAATATQLIVTVPSGATTGSISVTAPSGAATSSTSFTVTSSTGTPTISGFTPSIGAVGTAISISGTNFDVAANDKTRFNVALATATSATSSSVSTSVPTGATSGHISVTTPIGKAVSMADFFAPPSGYTTGAVGFTGRMTLGGTSTVTLGTAGQIALLIFDGTAGQRVSVNLTGGTFPYLGLSVSLLTPVGTTLSSASGLSTSGFLAPQTLPVTGTYTILFVAAASATGSISVSPNAVADISGTITPNGAGIPVNIAAPGQVARLAFSGTAGQRMSVNMTSGTFAYPGATVSMLNPNGTVLGSVGVPYSAGFLPPQTLPTTGTYTILFAPYNSLTGSMTVNLYSVTDISGTITPNGSGVVVNITTPGQVARLTFSGTAAQRMSVNLTSGTIGYPGLTLSLLKPDGSALASVGGTSPFMSPQTLPTTGTYTLLLAPSGALTGSITANLYTVTDISGTITAGGSGVVVNITTPGQVARLTFSGTAAQRVSVNLTNGTINYPGLTVSLLNPNGTTLGSVGVPYSAGFLSPQTLPTTGTYTILLAPSGALTGGITVNLYTVTDISGTIAVNGSGVAVNITTPGQVARLTFSDTSGQTASVYLTSGTFAYPGAGVSLLNPDGTTLASVGVTTSSHISSQTLPQTGTYTILIAPSGALTGSVTVSLTSP